MKKIIWFVPVLAIVAGMLVNYFYSSATQQRIGHLGEVDYPALASSQALLVDLRELEEVFKNAVSTADKNGLQQAAAHADAFKRDLKTLAALPGLEAAGADIEREFSAYDEAATNAASIMLGIKDGDVSNAAPAMQSTLKALTTRLQATSEQAGTAFASGLRASQDNVRASLIANTIAAVVILVVSLGVSRISVSSVMRQLGGTPEHAKAVVQRVADGDLAAPVPTQTGDTGSLLVAMKTMQQRLADVISEVRASVASIGTAAGQISTGYTQLSERTTLQASSLDESTSSLMQLSVTVKRNADSASEANRLAGNAAAVAVEGGKVVGTVVATMDEINASSRKVADIITVIDSIAFQTNILALNAAVEAARAGEQGRGFAVVASEVRNLAQRSAAAAKEIKGLIDDSVGKVDTGAKQVQAAGATMSQIVTSVNQVRDIINEIASASAEQTDGFELVNQAIGRLDGVAQQNAKLVEEAAAATTSLQQLAHHVSDAVSVFRLSTDDQGAPSVAPIPA